MSGAAKTLCSSCGIPTKYEDGTCQSCRGTTAPRSCRMCASLTRSEDRYCQRCTYLLSSARRYVPSAADGLGVGAWMPKRGVRVWVSDSARETA